jgi:hypothetical protein
MGNLSGMEEMNNYCDKRVHMGTTKRFHWIRWMEKLLMDRVDTGVR